MKPIFKTALLDAGGTAAYIIAVASFLFYAPKIFGRPQNVLIPIVMLLLFVFSAALTGSLILGRPALWYLDGRKKGAISLLLYTLGIFLLITLAGLSVLFILRAR